MDEPDKRPDLDHRAALDARDWIVRLASGHISEAELERFKQWREQSSAHKRAFERERAFWQQLQILDGNADSAPAFHAAPVTGRRQIGRRAFLAGSGAVVAATGAAIAIPRLHLWWNADFTTAVGEQADIPLPDGSVARLNTDSAIAVNFTKDLRLVTLLKGEAEFRVKPDASSLFRVAALGGNSDALGTIFSVQALEDTATITVREGHVRVSGPAAPSELDKNPAGKVELVAGRQTRYAAGQGPDPASTVDTDIVMAWRDGKVIFEGRPFASAVAELGRYMPERIVLAPGVRQDVSVSAIFSISDALDAVQALARTQGRTARRIPGVVILIA